MQRYSEAELVSNRSPVLLYGGSPADRRAWAEEAWSHFEHEGELRWVSGVDALGAALAMRRGVVAIEDVTALDDAAQAQILNCLMRQEERPKLVLGIQTAASAAVGSGALREDLHYRLMLAQVDLSDPVAKAAFKAREPQRRARETAKRKAAEQAEKERARMQAAAARPVRRPVIGLVSVKPVKAGGATSGAAKAAGAARAGGPAKSGGAKNAQGSARAAAKPVPSSRGAARPSTGKGKSSSTAGVGKAGAAKKPSAKGASKTSPASRPAVKKIAAKKVAPKKAASGRSARR
jgi:hypothetical protein